MARRRTTPVAAAAIAALIAAGGTLAATAHRSSAGVAGAAGAPGAAGTSTVAVLARLEARNRELAQGRRFTESRPGNSLPPAIFKAVLAHDTRKAERLAASMGWTAFDEREDQVLRGIVPDGVTAVVPVDAHGKRYGEAKVVGNLFEATVPNAVAIDHVEFVR